MTDLVEFYRARLDEDEQLWRAWGDGPRRNGKTFASRMLREVEAKRQIVNYEADGHLRGLHIDAWGIWRDQLKLLALPYADHPDYDEAWRLSTSA